MQQFSESKVEYASHQLSLYYGECPHACKYCFLEVYRKRNWDWACGKLRLNEKAFSLVKEANKEKVSCLVVSFTNDPLPKVSGREYTFLFNLIQILCILEKRKIPTKVLTKNAGIKKLSLYTKPFEYIQIGCSLTTNRHNNDISYEWEPNASSIEDRYSALEFLYDKGFRTWASVEPILPKTDISTLKHDLEEIRIEEVWLGKGSYHSELIKAHNWYQVLQNFSDYSRSLFIKKELKKFLVTKPLLNYMEI